MKAIAKCRECGEISTTEITQGELDKWVSGASAQTVWPSKSSAEREIVLQSQYVKLLRRPFPAYYICDHHGFWELRGGLPKRGEIA